MPDQEGGSRGMALKCPGPRFQASPALPGRGTLQGVTFPSLTLLLLCTVRTPAPPSLQQADGWSE